MADENRFDKEGLADLAVRVGQAGIWQWRAQDDTLDVDARYREIFGLEAGIVPTMKQVLAQIHPADRPRVVAALAAATDPAGKGQYSEEARYLRPDGGLRHLVSYAQARFAGGRCTGLLGMVQDLTEMRLASDALEASERRYRALFDSLDEGFCLIRMIYGAELQPLDYRFVEYNRTFEEQTGLKDALGKTALELIPGLEQHWVQVYADVALTGQPARFVQGSEAMGRWFDVFAMRMGGTPQDEVAIVFKDVSDQKRIEYELRDQARHKDEFLAILAHELRNPLVPIRVSLHTLKRDANPEAVAHAAQVIDRQLDQLVHLVDDLMDVSRVTRGKISLRLEPQDLEYIVLGAIEASQATVDESGQRLELYKPVQPLTVMGDPVRITQIVTNLLNNAARYGRKGGVVRVELSQDGGEALIEVSDEGIGISEEKMPHIFDMFVQVEKAGTQASGGLGIGLTLVRRLVELHGGRVSVHSDGVGQGSRFSVWLPLLTEARIEPAASSAPAPEVRASLQGLKVLVVDDNRDAAESLQEWLESLGAHAAIAHDGATALSAAEAFQPDVALLDLGLPGGMDGWSLAGALRGMRGVEALMIVAISGWGSPVERERSAAAGIDEHMTKPPDLGALLRLLQARASRS